MSNRNDLPVKKEGATCCELQDMAYSQSGISGNPALHQEDQPRRQLRGKGLYFFFSTPFFTLCRLKNRGILELFGSLVKTLIPLPVLLKSFM